MKEAKTVSLRCLSEKDPPRIQAEQIQPIPLAMVIALVGKGLLVPSGKAIVDQQVEFEMDMSAVFGNALVRVGGMAHDRNGFTCLDRQTDPKAVANFAQVRVEREDLDTFNLMAEDNILAVVGEASLGVNVSN